VTDAILGKAPLYVDGKEGIRGVEIADAILLSTWLDRKVLLPVDEDLYLNELNKRRAVSRRKEGAETVADLGGSFGERKA
ncbi:MAG: gfo/Idh/MocA family oxidoreductase, partial [Eubacteriales bacterium]